MILVVCEGNYVRSPMLAAFLNREAIKHGDYIPFVSAGLSDWGNGREPDAHVQALILEYGGISRDVRPHQLTKAELDASTAAVVMEYAHQRKLQWDYHYLKSVYRCGPSTGTPNPGDIPNIPHTDHDAVDKLAADLSDLAVSLYDSINAFKAHDKERKDA